jgi:hypothetical protein
MPGEFQREAAGGEGIERKILQNGQRLRLAILAIGAPRHGYIARLMPGRLEDELPIWRGYSQRPAHEAADAPAGERVGEACDIGLCVIAGAQRVQF